MTLWERLQDLWYRYRVLLVGVLIGVLVFLAVQILTGVQLPEVSAFAVLIGGIPILLAGFVYLYQEARTGHGRERRLLDLNVELRRTEAELEALATTDALTGLHNRRYFYERLSIELGRTQRYDRPLALIAIDLDHFKTVNDTRGHQFGDFVLAETAVILRQNLRETDIVARNGGEEFAVLLPETNITQALAVAEKLREAFAGYTFDNGEAQPISLTLSLGVAVLSHGKPDADLALVAAADAALYAAKEAGRNRTVAAPEGELATAAD